MVSLQSTLDRCREMTEDVNFSAVRKWKEDHPGSKVGGYFLVYTPEELIHAAGMLPVGIFGAGNKIEISYADARVQSFICSVVRTTLELGLIDIASVADVMIFHNICDAARNLGGMWKRNFPQTTFDYIYYPHNLGSAGSVEYLRDEFKHVLTTLENVAGRKVSDDDLRQSIGIYNENRRLLRELYRIKRETSWLVTSAEAYALGRAGTMMRKEEHNVALKDALAEISQRDARPRDKVRVVFEGGFCEQPPLQFIEVLDEVCYVVDDDFLLGQRWYESDVPTDGDPLRALADSYVNRSVYSTVKYENRQPKAPQLVEKCRRANAQAAILSPAKFCEPALYDQTSYQRALDRAQIPHLVLEFEEKMMTFETVRNQIETFAESILFYPEG